MRLSYLPTLKYGLILKHCLKNDATDAIGLKGSQAVFSCVHLTLFSVSNYVMFTD